VGCPWNPQHVKTLHSALAWVTIRPHHVTLLGFTECLVSQGSIGSTKVTLATRWRLLTAMPHQGRRSTPMAAFAPQPTHTLEPLQLLQPVSAQQASSQTFHLLPGGTCYALCSSKQPRYPTLLQCATHLAVVWLHTRTWVACNSHNWCSFCLQPLVELTHEQHVAQLALALQEAAQHSTACHDPGYDCTAQAQHFSLQARCPMQR
jgi:hypothetical protein